jgi:hypothetical protein
MKTLLWIVAVICSGAIGFYFGIGCGASTLGGIAALNQVDDGISRIRVSLDALTHDDPVLANRLHEQNLGSALFQIGTYSWNVAHRHCSDKERDTLEAARAYSQAHPQVLGGAMRKFKLHALDVCVQKSGGA